MRLSGSITLHQSGRADPATVWERYARPSLWPTWSPQIKRVDVVEDRIRRGLSGSVWSYAPPPARFTILDVDEAERRWTWQVHLGPVEVMLDHAVDTAPRGSLTELTMRGPWPVILAYAPFAQLAMRRLVDA